MSDKKDVAVIGAGAVGCSIAFHLAKKGIKPVIIEKESIGARASGKAWAVVSYPPYILAAGMDSESYFGMPNGISVTQWQDLYWSAYFRLASLAGEIKEKSGVDIDYGSVPMTAGMMRQAPRLLLSSPLKQPITTCRGILLNRSACAPCPTPTCPGRSLARSNKKIGICIGKVILSRPNHVL